MDRSIESLKYPERILKRRDNDATWGKGMERCHWPEAMGLMGKRKGPAPKRSCGKNARIGMDGRCMEWSIGANMGDDGGDGGGGGCIWPVGGSPENETESDRMGNGALWIGPWIIIALGIVIEIGIDPPWILEIKIIIGNGGSILRESSENPRATFSSDYSSLNQDKKIPEGNAKEMGEQPDGSFGGCIRTIGVADDGHALAAIGDGIPEDRFVELDRNHGHHFLFDVVHVTSTQAALLDEALCLPRLIALQKHLHPFPLINIQFNYRAWIFIHGNRPLASWMRIVYSDTSKQFQIKTQFSWFNEANLGQVADIDLAVIFNGQPEDFPFVLQECFKQVVALSIQTPVTWLLARVIRAAPGRHIGRPGLHRCHRSGRQCRCRLVQRCSVDVFILKLSQTQTEITNWLIIGEIKKPKQTKSHQLGINSLWRFKLQSERFQLRNPVNKHKQIQVQRKGKETNKNERNKMQNKCWNFFSNTGGGWKPFEVNRQLVEIGFGESVWTFVKIPVVNSETLRRRWHLKKAAASFLLFFFLLFLRVRVCVCVCVCLSPSICNENRRQTRTRNGKETSTGWNLRPNSFLFQDANTHTHTEQKKIIESNKSVQRHFTLGINR